MLKQQKVLASIISCKENSTSSVTKICSKNSTKSLVQSLHQILLHEQGNIRKSKGTE